MTTPHRLVLWDIDQTLVDLSGVGAQLYRTTLSAATGVELRKQPYFAGQTERAITTDILTRHGIDVTEDTIARLWASLIDISERALPTLTQLGRALPGAETALSTVAGLGGVMQSLVTGNLREISRHKLSAFGLHAHVDFEIGGYGSLSAHRPDLVPHAVAAAGAKHGVEFEYSSVVVVGDTPNDVAAALDHGAVAVAVATGKYTADELRDASAHTVLADLSDTGAVHTALLGTGV